MQVSASQFAGGGFMPSDAEAANGQTGARGSAAGGKKSGVQHTLRPVTVKQLRDCCSSADQDSDAFVVSGQELHNIVVAGKVVSVTEQATAVQLIIDDGTGKAEVKFWLDNTESGGADQENQGGLEDPHGPSSRSEWREGTYVKIFGHLRVFQGKKHIVAFTVRPIQDKNELTFHMLDCVYTHLYTLNKSQGAVQVTGQKRVMGPMDTNTYQQPAPQQNTYQQAAGFGTGGLSGMTPVQQAAFDAFHDFNVMNQDQGLSFASLKQNLGGRFTEGQLRQAVEDLQNDGHIYTTIDDNHFKGTGA